MIQLIYLLVTLVFTQGILFMLFGPTISKWMCEILIGLIFIASFRNRFYMPAFVKYFMIFLSAFLISIYINGDATFGAFTFFRPFILTFMVFIASYNIDLSNHELKKIFRLVKLLVLLQLPVAIIKVLSIGITEKYIGTLGISGGSLHLIFPLIVIGYLIGFFLFFKRDKKYFVYIFLFILFGISGAKKGVPFYTIFIIGFSYYIYNRYVLNRLFNPRKILRGIFAGVAVLLLCMKLVPGLNPENKIGGSINFTYLGSKLYTYSYYNDKKKMYSGRFGGTSLIVNDLFGSTSEWIKIKTIDNAIFGFGPSSFHGDNYLAENEHINKKYGRIIPTGFIRTIFSIGLLGVIGFVLFYGKITVMLFNLFRRRLNEYSDVGKSLLFGSIVSIVIIWLDFFTYSFMYTYPIVYVINFFIMGQIIKKRKTLIFKSDSKYE